MTKKKLSEETEQKIVITFLDHHRFGILFKVYL